MMTLMEGTELGGFLLANFSRYARLISEGFMILRPLIFIIVKFCDRMDLILIRMSNS